MKPEADEPDEYYMPQKRPIRLTGICPEKSKLIDAILSGKAVQIVKRKSMIYTDRENEEWWKSLSRLQQAEIFDKALNTGKNPFFQEKMQAIRRTWDFGHGLLTPKQIEYVRKWA